MITIQNMKTPGKIFTIAFCTLIAVPAYSSDVTYADDSYTTGDTLTAADLNAKFNEIKTDVNDNDTRVNANATAIGTKANSADVTTDIAAAVAPKANSADVTTDIAAAVAPKANSADVTTAIAAAVAPKANSADVTTAIAAAVAPKANSADVTTDIAAAVAPKANSADVTTDIAAAVAPKANSADVTTAIAAAIAADNTCPSDMVAVGPLCVDKYEASVWDDAAAGSQISGATSGILNTCHQGGNDCADGAANPIYARSVTGVEPAYNLTQYQAAIACANVGKRLPTIAEWQMAAAGTTTGNGDGAAANCNNVAGGGGSLRNTGTPSNCVSTAGAYDMVGNVFEITANVYFDATLGLGTLTTTDSAAVVALGSDYADNGTNEDQQDAFVISPGDTGNTTSGFRCVK